MGRDYGAIVSDDPNDSTYPESPEYYGGHLVAESVSAQHRDTLTAVPDLIRVVEGFLNVRYEMLEGPQKDLLVVAAEAALRKAGVLK